MHNECSPQDSSRGLNDEAAWVNIVLTFPRYFLIIGLTVSHGHVFLRQHSRHGRQHGFELILPYALGRFVPVDCWDS